MRLSRAMLVANKEWSELRANTLLMLSMAALPALFVIMPVVIVAIGVSQAEGANADDLQRAVKDLPPGLTPQQIVVVMITRSWVGLFLMLPVFVPIVIAAQAIVGEKEKRTIEPLLASPLSTAELLLGKTLTSLVPGLLISWGGFAVFAVLINLVAWPHFGRLVLPDATWLIAVFVVSPALALFGNGLSVLVSSRVNDARLAQQLAGTAVLPLVALIVVQMARGLAFGPQFYLVMFAILAVVDVALYAVAIRIFDRERILTSLR